jgi:urease accessory protein
MRARARVVAEADGRGGTRLTVLRGDPPLLPRRTGGGSGVTVHLVGGAAGPLGGDDLRLDVEVGPGARLTVRSVAASLALPGPHGAPPSLLAVRASVAAGAGLCWAPEPLIAAAGCRHRAVADVTVAAGGRLLWRDELVCGRHGEEPGEVDTDTTVRYAGATLHRHQLAVGPRAPGWAGAAVLGGARAVGSLLLAGPGLAAPGANASSLLAGLPPVRAPGPACAVMALAGPGLLALVVGVDSRAVRAALDPLCAAGPGVSGGVDPLRAAPPAG